MRTTIILLLLFPFIGHAQNRLADSLLLVEIYTDLKGEQWTGYETWLSDQPLEEWKGLRISGDRVVKVELINSNAEGVFPMALLEMDALETIEFRNANLSGPLPQELAGLNSLRRLSISSTSLSGEVPNIFKDLPNLKDLILRNNDFEGPLPDLGNDMSIVYLERNGFSGTVPDSYQNYSASFLTLNNNKLEGSFDMFSDWDELVSIDLSDNEWEESTFPQWVDDLPQLERFSCDNCNLSGDLPLSLDFSNSERYEGMFISDNNLSGDISLLFNNPDFGNPLYLRARSNNFAGELPLDKINAVDRLDVLGNQYSTLTALDATTVRNINLSSNNFTFESLEPIKEYIIIDTVPSILYRLQNEVLLPDTLMVTSKQSIEIKSGDEALNTTYEWYRNNQLMPDEKSGVLEIEVMDGSVAGIYHCIMKNDEFPDLELRRSPVLLEVDISTNTTDILTTDLMIYPNPSTTTLGVFNADGIVFKAYEIYNALGMIVQKGRLTEGNLIEVSGLSAGQYYLAIWNSDARFTSSFIKQ